MVRRACALGRLSSAKEAQPMNAEEAQSVKNLLLAENDGYRDLAKQHHELDHRLHELTEKPYLSTSEQLEEVALKKQKLVLKDRMEEMARSYRDMHSPAS
jgi:uncharacterized protein YdcH (DUF465 family)